MTDSRLHMEAVRTATALQMAILDRDDARVDAVIDGLDIEVLRATVRELAIIWSEVVAWNYRRADMRDALARDALNQAAMAGGPQDRAGDNDDA